MLSLTVAQELKTAGLNWTPAKNDFFAIPSQGLDEGVYVISDMTTLVEPVNGHLAVTFHGVVEWALDHVFISDLIWMPSETQLRELLEQHLVGESEPALQLISTADGYWCEIRFQGERLLFEAFGASEAYASALLHVLKNEE